MRPNTPTRHARGFTLIEVLVAISVMALMSLMAWRGIDGMLRTQTGLQVRADDIRTLQAGLAQWQTDLDQLTELKNTASWDWDGKVLRMTRRMAAAPAGLNDPSTPNATTPGGASLPDASEAVQVVAWTWRIDPARPGGGDWQRWQSAPLTTRAAWQEAWQLAQVWSQTPTAASLAGQVQIHPLSGWQLFVHRGGAWTNPLSSDAVTGPPANNGSGTNTAATPSGGTSGSTPPDGVRLILTLPPGAAGAGLVTRDWVRPTLSGTGA